MIKVEFQIDIQTFCYMYPCISYEFCTIPFSVLHTEQTQPYFVHSQNSLKVKIQELIFSQKAYTHKDKDNGQRDNSN